RSASPIIYSDLIGCTTISLVAIWTKVFWQTANGATTFSRRSIGGDTVWNDQDDCSRADSGIAGWKCRRAGPVAHAGGNAAKYSGQLRSAAARWHDQPRCLRCEGKTGARPFSRSGHQRIHYWQRFPLNDLGRKGR